MGVKHSIRISMGGRTDCSALAQMLKVPDLRAVLKYKADFPRLLSKEANATPTP